MGGGASKGEVDKAVRVAVKDVSENMGSEAANHLQLRIDEIRKEADKSKSEMKNFFTGREDMFLKEIGKYKNDADDQRNRIQDLRQKVDSEQAAVGEQTSTIGRLQALLQSEKHNAETYLDAAAKLKSRIQEIKQEAEKSRREFKDIFKEREGELKSEIKSLKVQTGMEEELRQLLETEKTNAERSIREEQRRLRTKGKADKVEMARKYAGEQAMRQQLEAKVKRMQKIGRIHVLFVGNPGAGKSSIINSLAAAYTGTYEAIRGYGTFKKAVSFTDELVKTDIFEFDENLLPGCGVFYDMPGLPDASTENIRALLKAVCDGRIPTRTKVLNLLANAKLSETLDAEYRETDAEMIIHLIVFVHSCEQEVPTNLASALGDLAQNLGIPVFSVLSKVDLVDTEEGPSVEDAARRRDDLEGSTGTANTDRRFELVSYCEKSLLGFEQDRALNYDMLMLWSQIENPHYIKNRVL